MRYVPGIVLALAVLSAISCNGFAASEPVGKEQEQGIKAGGMIDHSASSAPQGTPTPGAPQYLISSMVLGLAPIR